MKQQDDIALDPSAGTGITDTQRLDWLDVNGQVYGYFSQASGMWWMASEAQSQKSKYPSFSAAIDAAITGTDPCL